MMYEKDFVMRQIRMMVRFFAKLIFGVDTAKYEIPDPEHLSDGDRLYEKINALLASGDINAAENALFEGLVPGDKNGLLIALDFYRRLNDMDDETLDAHDFSRAEVAQGLRDAAALFGLDMPDV